MVEDKYLFIALGAIGMIAASKYFPQLKQLGNIKSVGCSKCASGRNLNMRLENVPGIDVNALNIARRNGLM